MGEGTTGDIDGKVAVQHMTKLDVGQGERIAHQIATAGETRLGNRQLLLQGRHRRGDGLRIPLGGGRAHHAPEHWRRKAEGNILL